MKKMIIAFLAVTLVFSLIGCDAMLNVMEKMSNNVAGTEKKVIEDAVNAATPAPQHFYGTFVFILLSKKIRFVRQSFTSDRFFKIA